MRVLHLVKTPTGARWAYRQMRELRKLGVDVHVALPPGSPMAPDYAAAGVVVHDLQTSAPMGRPRELPATLGSFRALVDEVRPDLVHSHFVGTTLTMRLALGRRSSIRRVFQVPGPLHLEHPFFRTAEFRSAGPPDFWIGSCRWTCARYRALGAPAERVHLSYYGLDMDDFPPPRPGHLRAELGIDPSAKIVGMVALMYPPKRYMGQRRGIKGHEDLIDALALSRSRGHDVVGVFVGGVTVPGHPYEARIHAYAAGRLGEHHRFLGTRRDVAALYPDFDVAVHPSHSENVGGAGESLLLAVPTVATNVGGLPDAVIPDRTGWLVPPRDPRSLANAVEAALANPAHSKELARNGEALMREMVDVRHNAGEVLAAYRAILATPIGRSR